MIKRTKDNQQKTGCTKMKHLINLINDHFNQYTIVKILNIYAIVPLNIKALY